MPDDSVLSGLDPHDLMDAEAARIDAFVRGLDDSALAAPSACAGWSVQDVVAHLASGEEYNHACLDDDVAGLFQRLGALGVKDLDSFNAHGVESRRGRSADFVLAEWRDGCERTRGELRERDGGDIPTSIGPYPARWQAFHLASELATHGDDIGAPPAVGTPAGWRERFAVFALSEKSGDIDVSLDDGDAVVTAAGEEARLPADVFVAATNGRLDPSYPLSPALRSALNVVGS